MKRALAKTFPAFENKKASLNAQHDSEKSSRLVVETQLKLVYPTIGDIVLPNKPINKPTFTFAWHNIG